MSVPTLSVAGPGGSAGGVVPTADQLVPMAEDPVAGVLAVIQRKVALANYTPSILQSLGAATTGTAKSSSGVLYAFTAANRNAAARYFQIFNSTGGTGTVFYQWLIPATTGQITVGADFFTREGWWFSTGITWGVSTTAGSYVAATASETDVAMSYK